MGTETDPPAPPMDNDEIRKTLTKLATAEHKRAGASALTSKLLAFFGSVVTAAAIGGFVWILDANAQHQSHDSQIERVRERAAEHDPTPPGHEEIENAQRQTDRRVDAIENAQRSTAMRLDRMEKTATKRNDDVIDELRRLRTARRTWGGN